MLSDERPSIYVVRLSCAASERASERASKRSGEKKRRGEEQILQMAVVARALAAFASEQLPLERLSVICLSDQNLLL